jgi:hypothetical protein
MRDRITILALATALATFSFGAINAAQAENPLNYPPFSWPSDKPAKPSSSEKKDPVKAAKPDIYQSRDASKQWVDGDFLGMDDD